MLQLKLLDTGLVGRDGGALDTNAILLDGLGRIDSDLVVGLITVLQTLRDISLAQRSQPTSQHTRS